MSDSILVTGATGFIGRHLIKQLIKENKNVCVLVRTKADEKYFSSEVSIKIGDLTNLSSLIDACRGVQTIYHLAGFAHVTNQRNPNFNEKHYKINFLGTKNLILAAESANIHKFIFFSSTKAVGDASHCINETWKKAPNTPYGIAKRDAEALVINFGQRSKAHTCILRPALVYGPGCKGNLFHMIKAIDKGYFLPIPNIPNRRSMISLHDICQIAILAANNTKTNNQVYFVTDGNAYSTYQLYFNIKQALGKNVPSWHVPFSFFKLMGYIGDVTEKIIKKDLPINTEKILKLFDSAEFDSTRLQEDLNFKPHYDFFSALPEMIAAYREVIERG